VPTTTDATAADIASTHKTRADRALLAGAAATTPARPPTDRTHL
jgi:hypothetical protein